jgi:predicted enzyme related to lactoylglutathione lyase
MHQAIPVLPAINIKETILFYESKLGFTTIDKGGYIIMKKNNAELHFFLCHDKYLCENTTCYIKVKDIECLYSRLSLQDIVELKGKLENKPRGIKEFSIRDNNGNLLKFVNL